MKIFFTSLLLSLFCLTGCLRIQEPEFRSINDFRLKNLGLEEATIGLRITYYNPNNFSVTVKETEVNMFLEAGFLGRFVQDTAVAVQSHADFSIPLSGTVPLSVFLNRDVKDIHKREVLIKAEGRTKVGKAGIFITQPIHYAGRHQLKEIIWAQKIPLQRD